MKRFLCILGFIGLWIVSLPAATKTLTVAVTSSLEPTFKVLKTEFEKETGISLKASYGSTGQLTTHIRSGAPFDVFLSADIDHVLQLEKEGLVTEPQVFALGSLVLVGTKSNETSPKINALRSPNLKTIAIANPTFAPYGVATLQVLKRTHLFHPIQHKIVWGESVGQVAGFLMSQTVDAAFMAQSQWMALEEEKKALNWVWVVPTSLYDPIEQCATRIKSSKASEAAQKFLTFLHTDPAKHILQASGYHTKWG